MFSRAIVDLFFLPKRSSGCSGPRSHILGSTASLQVHSTKNAMTRAAPKRHNYQLSNFPDKKQEACSHFLAKPAHHPSPLSSIVDYPSARRPSRPSGFFRRRSIISCCAPDTHEVRLSVSKSYHVRFLCAGLSSCSFVGVNTNTSLPLPSRDREGVSQTDMRHACVGPTVPARCL